MPAIATDAGACLAETARWARTPLAQLRGLIGSTIAPGEALLLPGCPQVHTALLAYPVDVAFCAGSAETGFRLLCVQTLVPWSVSRFVRGATLAIEMRAGSPLPALEPGSRITLR